MHFITPLYLSYLPVAVTSPRWGQRCWQSWLHGTTLWPKPALQSHRDEAGGEAFCYLLIYFILNWRPLQMMTFIADPFTRTINFWLESTTHNQANQCQEEIAHSCYVQYFKYCVFVVLPRNTHYFVMLKSCSFLLLQRVYLIVLKKWN